MSSNHINEGRMRMYLLVRRTSRFVVATTDEVRIIQMTEVVLAQEVELWQVEPLVWVNVLNLLRLPAVRRHIAHRTKQLPTDW